MINLGIFVGCASSFVPPMYKFDAPPTVEGLEEEVEVVAVVASARRRMTLDWKNIFANFSSMRFICLIYNFISHL